MIMLQSDLMMRHMAFDVRVDGVINMMNGVSMSSMTLSTMSMCELFIMMMAITIIIIIMSQIRGKREQMEGCTMAKSQ